MVFFCLIYTRVTWFEAHEKMANSHETKTLHCKMEQMMKMSSDVRDLCIEAEWNLKAGFVVVFFKIIVDKVVTVISPLFVQILLLVVLFGVVVNLSVRRDLVARQPQRESAYLSVSSPVTKPSAVSLFLSRRRRPRSLKRHLAIESGS